MVCATLVSDSTEEMRAQHGATMILGIYFSRSASDARACNTHESNVSLLRMMVHIVKRCLANIGEHLKPRAIRADSRRLHHIVYSTSASTCILS